MGTLPQIPNIIDNTKRQIVEFKGYSNNPQIADGEMRDMLNLSSDQYPYLTQRQPRGVYSAEYNNVGTIMTWKEKLVIIDGNRFFYNGELKGLLDSTATNRQVAGINTKLVFYPDKRYYDLTDDTIKNIESTFVTDTTGAEVTKENNKLTINGFDNASLGFAVGDAVDLAYKSSASDVKLSTVIKAVDNTTTITFPDNTFTDVAAGAVGISEKAYVKITRLSPDMDYIMEANNRLWGCKGNFIYSSKLGDPTNWNYFQNTAADSYAVEVGTDGDFTGLANFPSHLVFFKEQHMHKLYGANKPSSYEITTMECNGMEEGSFASAVTVDGVLYYKSKIGIMAYTGDYPVNITSSFKTKYINASAGTDKIKYYISMQNAYSNEWEMFVYDYAKKMWHKEDNTHGLTFTNFNGRLMYYDYDLKMILYAVTDGTDAYEGDNNIEWNATFGEFDELLENKKIYSRLQMRFTMGEDSDMTIYLAVDDNEFVIVNHITNERKRAMMQPIIPRRCQKFRIKLSGHGYARIESLVRLVREGSEI